MTKIEPEVKWGTQVAICHRHSMPSGHLTVQLFVDFVIFWPSCLFFLAYWSQIDSLKLRFYGAITVGTFYELVHLSPGLNEMQWCRQTYQSGRTHHDLFKPKAKICKVMKTKPWVSITNVMMPVLIHTCLMIILLCSRSAKVMDTWILNSMWVILSVTFS